MRHPSHYYLNPYVASLLLSPFHFTPHTLLNVRLIQNISCRQERNFRRIGSKKETYAHKPLDKIYAYVFLSFKCLSQLVYHFCNKFY